MRPNRFDTVIERAVTSSDLLRKAQLSLVSWAIRNDVPKEEIRRMLEMLGLDPEDSRTTMSVGRTRKYMDL